MEEIKIKYRDEATATKSYPFGKLAETRFRTEQDLWNWLDLMGMNRRIIVMSINRGKGWKRLNYLSTQSLKGMI